MPLCYYPEAPILLGPMRHLICFLFLWICPFRVFLVLRIVQGVALCDWLLSLSITFPGFLHLVACARASFLLVRKSILSFGVFVCLGRHDKIPGLGASLKVLEAGNLGSGCWQGSFLLRPLLALQTATFSPCPHVVTLQSVSVSVFRSLFKDAGPTGLGSTCVASSHLNFCLFQNMVFLISSLNPLPQFPCRLS